MGDLARPRVSATCMLGPGLRRLGTRHAPYPLPPSQRGESFYNPMLKDVVGELREKGVAVESEGATCVFVDGKEVPLIVQKSDGGYGYASTDMAAIKQRIFEEKADWMIYVTDSGQAEHITMVFAAARKAGWLPTDEAGIDVSLGVVIVGGLRGGCFTLGRGSGQATWVGARNAAVRGVWTAVDGSVQPSALRWHAFTRHAPCPCLAQPPRATHVGFGLVLGEDGKKFKTRSGDVVRLVELLDEAKSRCRDTISARREEVRAAPRNRTGRGAELPFRGSLSAWVTYVCEHEGAAKPPAPSSAHNACLSCYVFLVLPLCRLATPSARRSSKRPRAPWAMAP